MIVDIVVIIFIVLARARRSILSPVSYGVLVGIYNLIFLVIIDLPRAFTGQFW